MKRDWKIVRSVLEATEQGNLHDFVSPSSLLNSHFDKHMNNNHLSNLQKKQTDGHTQSVIQAICIIHYFTTAYVTLRKNRFNSVLRQTYLNTCH